MRIQFLSRYFFIKNIALALSLYLFYSIFILQQINNLDDDEIYASLFFLITNSKVVNFNQNDNRI
jgi:hypothetical protein